jgi:peptide/nickel transport system substrate-binding protein/dipeptide transport system substrate-binding protein
LFRSFVLLLSLPSRLLRAALAAAALLLAGPVVQAKPIVFCSDASPEGFDPAEWDAAGTNQVNNQMFQGLLGFKRGGTELEPLLASAWTVSPDAKVFTFTLRRGVHFHHTPYFTPTRDFNADDVLFTFGRYLNPKHPYNLAFPAFFVYPQNLGLAQAVEKLEKLDDFTVRFTLKQANVTFASYFAMAFAGITSAEYGEQLLKAGKPASINNYPVGTGPYRFVSYKKDFVVRMEANPDYWGNKQRTDKLIFLIARDANVRVQQLLGGECHITAPIRDNDIASIEPRKDLVVMKTQALNISYLSFNMKKGVTRNRDVREALDIAFDRDAAFRALFPRGDAMQAVSAFPPVVAGYDKSLKNEFNPARAKQLLAKAGYPDGLSLDLWALPVQRPTNPNGQLLAQMIQQDWAKIGVKASIKTYEWGEYLKRANKGEHDVYMSGWSGESGDPDDFLTPTLSCASSADGVKFCNAEFDKLITEARGTTDVAKRMQMYEKAQQIFKHERPWITLAHSTVYIPMVRDIRGFVMAPNGSVDFKDVYRQ